MIQIIKHESVHVGKCSTCYNININGGNLYNMKVAQIWKTAEQNCIIDLQQQKRFVLPIITIMYTYTISLPRYYRNKIE